MMDLLHPTFLASNLMPQWLELAGTLLAFEGGVRLQRRLGGSAVANPVLVAVLLLSSTLAWLGVPATDYTANVQTLTFLLGPATVALAVPLYRNLPRIRQALGPVLVSVVAGVAVASSSVLAIAATLGAPTFLLLSIAPKSATAAIAMAVAQEIGGDPALAAGLAVLTGIFGAVICTGLFDLIGVRDPRARGLATGIAAHGIGTARMLALDAEAGAFAGLGMGLAGLTIGALMPLAANLLHLASR